MGLLVSLAPISGVILRKKGTTSPHGTFPAPLHLTLTRLVFISEQGVRRTLDHISSVLFMT